MLSNETIGSAVVLYYFGRIIEKATINGQTACYWHLSNGQRFQKELGYYFDRYSKSMRIDVKFWNQDVEADYQAHLETKRLEAALSAQKSELEDYISYMRFNYLKRLSSAQISKILTVCQEQIGDITQPRTR